MVDQLKVKRSEKYYALSVAREWLYVLHEQNMSMRGYYNTQYRDKMSDNDLRHGLEKEKNGHATSYCMCKVLDRQNGVDVKITEESQRAYYQGLFRCNHIWSCPLCVDRVRRHRLTEIKNAVAACIDEGETKFHAMMVTLTFPHTKFDNLHELFEKQAEAFGLFRRGKRFSQFSAEIGYVGLIRSLEITHTSQNGWHPHTHELWFTSAYEFEKQGKTLVADPNKPITRPTPERVLSFINDRWFSACLAVGLVESGTQKEKDFRAHAVDVKFLNKSDRGGEYIYEDGCTWEMASSTTKRGKTHSRHPFDFLIDQLPGDRELFFHYIQSTKGKRQLYWSRNLRQYLGLTEEIPDEEILESQTDAIDLILGNISAEQWSRIRKRKAQAFVLELSESHGWQAVQDFIETIQ